MSANDKQVGGQHYKGVKVEHWDFVRMHNIQYMEAQIIKYVMRHRYKNGKEDIEKAKHFLDKLLEQEYSHGDERRIVNHNPVIERRAHPPEYDS